MVKPSPISMTADAAEALAVDALGWLAASPDMLQRFLAISGVEPSMMRSAVNDPSFLTGVLQFIAADERTLLRFCEEQAIDPALVLPAIRLLPGGADAYDRSI